MSCYQPASWYGTHSGCQSGVTAFWQACLRLLPWLANSGCYNDRPVTGGTAPSLHREGRARDLGIGWPGTAGYEEHRLAMWGLLWRIVDNWQALGVQQIIFNGHIWRCDRAAEGWRTFSAGNGGQHHDHAHVEFTWHAAHNLTLEQAVQILTPKPPTDPIQEDDLMAPLYFTNNAGHVAAVNPYDGNVRAVGNIEFYDGLDGSPPGGLKFLDDVQWAALWATDTEA